MLKTIVTKVIQYCLGLINVILSTT